MLAAALRRFAGLLLVIAAGTAACSLAIGLAAGSSPVRSLSIGFYLIGSFLLISGFFVGNRGPVRPQGNDPGIPFFGPLMRHRMLRWATVEEREESLSLSVVFVVLGVVLILFGVLTDTRYKLY
jgi:Ca2+/Na+ antiporter